jgi:hypothetical protein
MPPKGYGLGGIVASLASGGVGRAQRGGLIARLGEGRRDEAVMPLPRGWERNWSPNPETATAADRVAARAAPLIGEAVIHEEADADRVVRQLDFLMRARGIKA